MPPRKLTVKEIQERISLRYPTENFKIIKYENLGKPLEVQCLNCKQIIKVNKASNFFAPSKAYGCANCHGLWRDREYKLNKIKELYDITDTFVKESHTYYTIKCKNCGHLRTSTLNNFFKHLDCGCSTGIFRNRTAEEFIKLVNKAHLNEKHELISPYVNQTTKVLIKHSKCGFIWNAWPHDLIAGRSRCPKCFRKESRGAALITKLLIKYNISFEKEKRLNNSKQRFDFYIEKENLKIAIEYNGSQHYQETNYFQTSLEQQQERDIRKAQYCLDNNILLYIIPYTYSDFEIENIIIQINNRLNDYPVQEQL